MRNNILGNVVPLLRATPWFPGQLGIRGSDNSLGLRTSSQGMVWYVDGSHPNANDLSDGTNPHEPLATIGAAITKNNATIDWAATPPYVGQNWIIVAPGVYAENLAVPFYCKIIGLGQAVGGDVCVNVEPVAGSPVAGTGLGTHYYNIRFTCNTAVPVLDFGVMNSCIIESCMIVDGNPGLATVGIDTTDAGGSSIIDCNFTFNTNPLTIGIRSTGDFFDCKVIGNYIAAVTTGIDLSGAGLVGNAVIAHNMICGGGAVLLATGIDDSVVGDSFCVDNWVSATDAISHADLANMCIANHVLDAGVGAVEAAGTD